MVPPAATFIQNLPSMTRAKAVLPDYAMTTEFCVKWSNGNLARGAEARTRTGTGFPPVVFETTASAYSATSALDRSARVGDGAEGQN